MQSDRNSSGAMAIVEKVITQKHLQGQAGAIQSILTLSTHAGVKSGTMQDAIKYKRTELHQKIWGVISTQEI